MCVFLPKDKSIPKNTPQLGIRHHIEVEPCPGQGAIKGAKMKNTCLQLLPPSPFLHPSSPGCTAG